MTNYVGMLSVPLQCHSSYSPISVVRPELGTCLLLSQCLGSHKRVRAAYRIEHRIWASSFQYGMLDCVCSLLRPIYKARIHSDPV